MKKSLQFMNPFVITNNSAAATSNDYCIKKIQNNTIQQQNYKDSFGKCFFFFLINCTFIKETLQWE